MTRLFYRPAASYNVSRDPFNALVREFFASSQSAADQSSEMKVQVKEAANEYHLLAELPGVAKDEIDIEITGTDVKISAQTKQGDQSENAADEWTKRSYARSFTLPVEIDDEKAAAKFENGVLSLTLPKKAANAAKRLMVA
jgi:HSP20 family protein